MDEKEKKLRQLAKLIKDGNAGVDRNGNLVDIRSNPDTVKVRKHS